LRQLPDQEVGAQLRPDQPQDVQVLPHREVRGRAQGLLLQGPEEDLQAEMLRQGLRRRQR
jgi:hypothetical protein